MYGKLTDKETGNPIEGARFYYSVNNYRNSYLCTSDADGHYDFNQQLEFHDYGSEYSPYDYSIYIEKDNYATYSGIEVLHGWIVEQNFSLTRPSYLNVHIKNNTPYDSNDIIHFTNAPEFYYETNKSYLSYTGKGQNIDTTLFRSVNTVNVLQKLSWYVIKNNDSTYHYEYIYFASGDTVFYTVNY